MTESDELAELFARDLTRLEQQIAALPEDALYRTLPGITNSAANLTLHLEGNLREYIGRQLGHRTYERNRPLEFAGTDVTKLEILARIEALRQDIPAALSAYSNWSATYPEEVFGSPISTRQFVIHLHGHFNYHLGQINYLRRLLTSTDPVTRHPDS